MMVHPLTDAERATLSLLTAELPPDPAYGWRRAEMDHIGTVGFCGQVGRRDMTCAPFQDGGWALRGFDLIGIGPTIPAAIADFRAKVAAAAVAVGALPKAVPVQVERWQSFALANFAHPDDVVGGEPPAGWEGAGPWEPVTVAAPVDISHYPQVLWKRPLRRVESQKAEV